MKKIASMQVGDTVEWTSQGAGTTRKKHGVIVAVIAPGENPMSKIMSMCGHGGFNSQYGMGLPRREQTYLVACETKSGRGAKKLYWPRSCLLKPVLLKPENPAVVPLP